MMRVLVFLVTIIAISICQLSVGSAAIIVTGISPGQWQASDASLGLLAGSTIYGFDNTTLPSGMTITLPGQAATNTLPNLFNPLNTSSGGSDPVGTAFLAGLWDGSNVLINRTNNSMAGDSIYETTTWGNVTFSFSTGVTQFGVSLQQNNVGATILVNGNNVGSTAGLFSLGGGRNGYLRIDSTIENAITSVSFINNTIAPGITDGFAFDHLSFSSTAVPEPGTFAIMFGISMTTLSFSARRRRDLSSTPLSS